MSIADILKSKVNGLLNKKDWDFTPKSLSYRIQEAKAEVEKIMKPTIINKVSKEMAEPAFKLFPDGPSRQEVFNTFKKTPEFANNILDFGRGALTRPIGKSIVSIADAANLKPIAGPNKGQKITQLDINTPANKFVFGNQPLTSYQQDSRNAGKWFQDIGINQGTASKLGFAAGIVNAGLDLPGGSLVKSVGKKVGKEIVEEVGEKAIKEGTEQLIKTGENTLDDAIKQKLRFLVRGVDDLV